MRRPFFVLVFAASAVFGLAGCRGKLLATARLTAPGSAEVHFRGGGKSYRLWSDYDGSWKGSNKNSRMPLHYDVEVIQNGKSLAKLSCDTDTGNGTSVCGTQTRVNDQHSGNCEVSLSCSLPDLAASDVTLKVNGKYADPARVSHVSNMSLNVRED